MACIMKQLVTHCPMDRQVGEPRRPIACWSSCFLLCSMVTLSNRCWRQRKVGERAIIGPSSTISCTARRCRLRIQTATTTLLIVHHGRQKPLSLLRLPWYSSSTHAALPSTYCLRFRSAIPSVRLHLRRALALGSVVPHVHPVHSFRTALPLYLLHSTQHSDACFPRILTYSCVLTCLPAAKIHSKT